jgi:hypothetical protein
VRVCHETATGTNEALRQRQSLMLVSTRMKATGFQGHFIAATVVGRGWEPQTEHRGSSCPVNFKPETAEKKRHDGVYLDAHGFPYQRW